MTRVFNEYARKIGLLKEKDKNLEGTDIREGLLPLFLFVFQKIYYNLKVKQKENLVHLKHVQQLMQCFSKSYCIF